jgi:hypothetical protein
MKNFLLLTLTLFCYTLILNADDKLSWKIVLSPSDAGTVEYSVDSPFSSGTLNSSAAVKFFPGAFIDITIKPKNGFRILAVFKNSDDITSWFDSNNHYQFGPVDHSHIITVTFGLQAPTGTHSLTFPDNPPENLAEIADVTGHYSGVTPVHKRNYDIDAAMDEDGKVLYTGNVDGVKSDETGSDIIGLGQVKTENNKPVLSGHLKGEGSLDGTSASAKGKITVPLVLKNQSSPDDTFVEGEMSYSAVKDSVKYKDKLVPVKKTVTDDDKTVFKNRKKWSIEITLTEEMSDSKKPSQIFYASGKLTLPDKILYFDKKKVKFGIKKGFNIVFRKGKNASGQTDKKTKINIKNMTFRKNPDSTWSVTGGTIKYKILNQKGQGNLTDFLWN